MLIFSTLIFHVWKFIWLMSSTHSLLFHHSHLDVVNAYLTLRFAVLLGTLIIETLLHHPFIWLHDNFPPFPQWLASKRCSTVLDSDLPQIPDSDPSVCSPQLPCL